MIKKQEFETYFNFFSNHIEIHNGNFSNILNNLNIKYLSARLNNVIKIVKFKIDFQPFFVKSFCYHKFCTFEKNKLGFFPKQVSTNRMKKCLRYSFYCLNQNNGKHCPKGNVLFGTYYYFQKLLIVEWDKNKKCSCQ